MASRRRTVKGVGRLSRLARAVVLVAIVSAVLVVGGCGATTPSTIEPSAAPSIAQPSGAPVLGIDWGRAESVERPENFDGDKDAPAYTGTHPILRIPGQAIMTDVVGLPAGGFVAVGYVPPAWVPAAWTSPDGATWTIHEMGATDFTFPVAIAFGGDDTVVAVGRSGNLPIAWTSRDGVAWQRNAVPVLGDGDAPERMTIVVAGANGYVAGGSVGPELFERHARFWTSVNGIDWQTVPDDPATFANAEVRAITAFGDGFVAVGVVGPAQEPAGAVAWMSPDGRTWSRVDDPSFADGIAVSVVPAPFPGVVAVGSDIERRHAVAWTSADGLRWSRAPDEVSREHSGGFAWMTDVVTIDDRVIAIGTFQGLQRGTGTSWVSSDGVTWERARTAPVQEQAEFYAVAPGGPGAVVVGSFGAPDSYVPGVWLSPAR